MKNNHPQILVLGATGMLGRTVYKYLSKLYGKNIVGTSREKNNDAFVYFNFKAPSDLTSMLQDQKFDFVINCIGALEGSDEKKLKLLNVNFSKKLSKASERFGFKIIHISTDAVFKSSSGNVDERSKPNPEGEYGKSKILGEIPSALNVRTSFLGFDPIKHKGLLEFVLKNRSKKITGFANQEWSGSTTLQLAEFIEWLISGNLNKLIKKTNTIHFAPLRQTTKYEILKVFSKLIDGSTIIKGKGPIQTRILKTNYIEEINLKRYGSSLEDAFGELIQFDLEYVKTYK